MQILIKQKTYWAKAANLAFKFPFGVTSYPSLTFVASAATALVVVSTVGAAASNNLTVISKENTTVDGH